MRNSESKQSHYQKWAGGCGGWGGTTTLMHTGPHLCPPPCELQMQYTFEKVDHTFKSHNIFSNVGEFQYFPVHRCFINTLQADHWYVRVRVRVCGLLWIVHLLHERRKTVNLKGLRTPDIDSKPRLMVNGQTKWSEGYNCTASRPFPALIST